MSEPIARRASGEPLLHPALGFEIHTEPLEPKDAEGLDALVGKVWDLWGPTYATAMLSCAEDAEPARRAHLDYVPTHAEMALPTAAPEPDQQPFHNRLTRYVRDDYYVMLSGAAQPAEAHPSSFRFWSQMGMPPDDLAPIPTWSVIHVTVPLTSSTEEIAGAFFALLPFCRVRWASLGLTYASMTLTPGRDAERSLFSHARRHPGYDLPIYEGTAEALGKVLRSVSWWTIVGPALRAQLEAARPLKPASSLAVHDLPDGSLAVRAGAAPEAGDVNRLQIPAAYRDADRLLRPIRATARDLHLPFPWTDRESEDWLRRFEPSPSIVS